MTFNKVLFSGLACVALAAIGCNGNTHGPGSSTDPNSPSDLGPKCTAYYGADGCCEEVAGGTSEAEQQCANLASQISDGLKQSPSSIDSVESQCARTLEQAQSAGKCGGGTSDGNGNGNGHGNGASGGDGLGPNCEAYYGDGGCCEKAAGNSQATKDACGQAGDTLKNAIKQNPNAATAYESTCKQALDTARQNHLCD